MSIFDDFRQWWLNTGQFLGPAATASEQELQLLHDYTKLVVAEIEASQEAEVAVLEDNLSKLEEERDNALCEYDAIEEKLSKLKRTIQSALDDA